MSLDETLQRWPKLHRMLLVVAFLLLVVAVLYGVFIVLPRRSAYKELLSEKKAIEKKLAESLWPQDSERLKSLLKDYERTSDGTMKRSVGNAVKTVDWDVMGAKDKAEMVLKHCTSMFDKRIANEYGDVSNFINKASQTEYKDLYDRTAALLEGLKVFLEPSIFGMDETTAEPAKYQMMLKMWTVEELVRRVTASKLQVVREMSVNTAGRGRPSKITVLPMIAYRLDERDKEPYLLEFPVRMEVSGSMENVIDFVRSLQPRPSWLAGDGEEVTSDECFLPMKQLEMLALSPQRGEVLVEPSGEVKLAFRKPNGELAGNRLMGQNGLLEIKQITATVICSSFFRPALGGPVRVIRRQVVEPLPLGL